MDSSDLAYMPAYELAGLIRGKELSPVEVVEATLARIDELNPRLNAIVTLDAEGARAAARAAEAAVMRDEPLGLLHGVPVTIKDLVPVAGLRHTFGSQLYADNVATQDAVAVERLRLAGAIILGKGNTPEFGHKGITDNLVFGRTGNPWNPERIPGGSSGGDAAAVAAGMAYLGLGTDGGGSIRIPASACGLFGIKPSLGRVPRYPYFNAWALLGHQGPLARTVRDGALMLQAIAGPSPRDPFSLPVQPEDYLSRLEEGDPLAGIPGLRVAWSPDLGYAAVDPEVRRLTEAAARAFADLGANVEQANPGFESPWPPFAALFSLNLAAQVGDRWDGEAHLLDESMVPQIVAGRQLSGLDVARAQEQQTRLWHTVRAFFDEYDLLLTPTLAVPPFPFDSPPTVIDGREAQPWDWLPFTYAFNLTGQPAASVPCGWTLDGLPVGLQIVGKPEADADVLRAAAAFERARPWHDRRPPTTP